MVQTLHGLITHLEVRSAAIAGMNLAKQIPDAPISGALFNFANQSADLDRLARCVNELVSTSTLGPFEVETAVHNLLHRRHFYGQLCEFGGYGWLLRNGVQFSAQQKIPASEVLNPNGCTVDGRLRIVEACFDIKAMGFEAHAAERFRRALQKRYGATLVVTIEGSMDIAVKDIEKYAFERLHQISRTLADAGIYQLTELGWIIRVERLQKFTTATTYSDPYRLAEENRHYPFKDASQFTRNIPFFLIFCYSAQFNPSLSVNFASGTDVTLRSLARRAFIELSADSTSAHCVDRKLPSGVRLCDASSLLSALLFVDLQTDQARLYLNPRATNKLTRYHVEQIFDFNPIPAFVDDFGHDNY